MAVCHKLLLLLQTCWYKRYLRSIVKTVILQGGGGWSCGCTSPCIFTRWIHLKNNIFWLSWEMCNWSWIWRKTFVCIIFQHQQWLLGPHLQLCNVSFPFCTPFYFIIFFYPFNRLRTLRLCKGLVIFCSFHCTPALVFFLFLISPFPFRFSL